MKNGKNRACFIHDIFKHNLCGKIHINIVCSLYTTNEFSFIIKRFRLMSVYKSLNLVELCTLQDTIQDLFGDNGVFRKFGFMCCDKSFLKINNLKTVTSLCKKKEFRLRHDFTELTVATCSLYLLIVIRKLHRS